MIKIIYSGCYMKWSQYICCRFCSEVLYKYVEEWNEEDQNNYERTKND